MSAKGWRKRQIADNMDKKILMKIRLRPDGTWEHVYDDGSVDQEFYQTSPSELARLHRIRHEKLIAYHSLLELQEEFIEQALESSDCLEAKSVLNHIMKL